MTSLNLRKPLCGPSVRLKGQWTTVDLSTDTAVVELQGRFPTNSSIDEVMEGTLERALRTARWANQAVEVIDDLGEVLASRAPLRDVGL